MTDPSWLWEQAARSYQDAGLTGDAARCYQRGGHFRRAGDLYRGLGRLYEAAEMYHRGHHGLEGAWLLAHELRDAAAARARLTELADARDLSASDTGRLTIQLLTRLVGARCDQLEGEPADGMLPVLLETQNVLAGPQQLTDQRVTEWAVAIAEAVHRYDQVALLFAAAVRGGRYGAAQTWSAWALARFGVPIVLPPADLGG